MKKNNLFKVVGITILAFALLSWIVPIVYGIAGIELAGEETVSTQIGFISIINVLLETFSGFGTVVLFILLVGAFYGALKATGAFDKIVNYLTSKATGKEKCALITTIIVMTLISSVSGLDLGLIVVFPLLIAFIVGMGYDKMVALGATLGATLVGVYGGTFAGTTYGTNDTLLELGKYSQMIPKVVFLVLGLAALLVLVIRYCESKKLVFDKESAKKALLIEGIVLFAIAFATGSVALFNEVFGGTKLLVTMIVLASVSLVAVFALMYALTKNIWKALTALFILVFGFSLAFTIGFANKSVASVLWIVLASVSLVALIALIVKLVLDCKKSKNVNAKRVNAKKESVVKSKRGDKKGVVAGLIIVGCLLLVLFLGTTSWGDIFKSNWFEKAHVSWTGFTVGGFAILNKLFGGIDAFGSWTTINRFQNYSALLIIAIIALKFAYKTKWADVLAGALEGFKEYVVPALLAVLAYSVFVFAFYNQFFVTLTNSILKTSTDFNVVSTGIYSMLNSVVYADYYYLSNSLLYNIKTLYNEEATLSIISVMFTNLYGLVMLMAPTSVLLLVSLSISDVKYTDWLKFIWKLLLALFVLSFVVFTIMVLV